VLEAKKLILAIMHNAIISMRHLNAKQAEYDAEKCSLRVLHLMLLTLFFGNSFAAQYLNIVLCHRA
jgi:hypothetical protein